MTADGLARLAAAIERTFPDIRPVAPLRVLGTGYRSVAVETPGGVVIRVGRSRDSAGDYAKEWRIGRFLAERLGALLPEPRWYTAPCAELPRGALGYMKLSGDTSAWGVDPGAAFARDLGTFMAQLHALTIDEARDAGVPDVDAYLRVLQARDVVMPVLYTRLDPGAFGAIGAWWAAFAEDERMRTAHTAVCHHHLWHDNLLRAESGRLSGVLDIAHVAITDPAHDFTAPRYFGDAFTAELVVAYRAAAGALDAGDDYRARRFWDAREFGGLAWAIEQDDQPEIDDAIQKIRRGPILRVC